MAVMPLNVCSNAVKTKDELAKWLAKLLCLNLIKTIKNTKVRYNID